MVSLELSFCLYPASYFNIIEILYDGRTQDVDFFTCLWGSLLSDDLEDFFPWFSIMFEYLVMVGVH